MFRIFGLFILLFQFQYVTAQESSGGENADSTFIYADKRVVIFSKDENFNKHLSYKEFTPSDGVYVKTESSVSKPISNSAENKKTSEYNLVEEVKIAKEKEKQIILDEVKPEIEKFKKKNSSSKKDFYLPQSTSKFYSSKTSFKDCVAPNTGCQDFCKQICKEESFQIKKALAYLHTQNFFYYNNKSYSHCFSNVFSVRPPPVNFSSVVVDPFLMV